MTTQTNLSEILRGCTPGRLQSVGLMQVIPLITELVDDRFTAPGQAIVSTTSYGTLVFRNTTPDPLIIPSGAAYVTHHKAQDHALPHAGIVGGKGTKTYHTAACIQQTQGGQMPAEQHQLMILPFPLREKALAGRREHQYQKLWAHISQFNDQMGVPDGRGHLDRYLDKYKQQLEEFVAEFESIPGQVGAIILLNGRVVGVERTPNYHYWQGVWETLIRECYGSLALYYNRLLPSAEVPRTRVPMGGPFTTIEQLFTSLQAAQTSEQAITHQIVGEVLRETMTHEAEDSTGAFVVETWQSQRFIGQTVRDGLKVVYASLVATEAKMKAGAWAEAQPFQV